MNRSLFSSTAGGRESLPEEALKAKARSLYPFFYPSSIAIIGASGDEKKPGGSVLKNLVKGGFPGKVFPVNSRKRRIKGLLCYPTVRRVPDAVDLAIISVPARFVAETLRDCAEKGVRGVIVFSSGFAETGEEGRKLQEELKQIAQHCRLKMCGPNCMGIVNHTKNLKAVFAYGNAFPVASSGASPTIGFITQSGGFGCTILADMFAQGMGISHYISTGNEAETDFSDFLAFLVDDPQTKIIAGYLEGVRDGKKLALVADLARKAKKPIVIFKAGRYQDSARAAHSHTGALAGSDLIYSAFFRQKGIIQAESGEELTAVLALLDVKALPQGKRAAILASSGGHGVVMTDKCLEAGLKMAALSGETRRKIGGFLPPFASTSNPIDFTGLDFNSPDLFRSCVELIAEDPGVDLIIFSYWLLKNQREVMAKQFEQVSRSVSKPMVGVILGGGLSRASAHIQANKRAGIPVIGGLESALKAINKLTDYSIRLKSSGKRLSRKGLLSGKDTVAGIVAAYPSGSTFTEAESKMILSAYGIPVATEQQASTIEEALNAAERIGYPVAVKVNSPDIPHKTEAKGIKLNLRNSREVREAFDEVVRNARHHNREARITGVLVQEMLLEGREVIVGIKRDSVFGPTVLFGIGGVLVEQLEDVSLRILPVTDGDIREMIGEIKGSHILESFRGNPPADKDAIIDLIGKVAQLAEDFPEIAEIDINPLMVFQTGKGAKAADALVVLQ